MADNTIAVQISAQVAELLSGMQQAAASVTTAVTGMKEQLVSLGETAKLAQERVAESVEGIKGSFEKLHGAFLAVRPRHARLDIGDLLADRARLFLGVPGAGDRDLLARRWNRPRQHR